MTVWEGVTNLSNRLRNALVALFQSAIKQVILQRSALLLLGRQRSRPDMEPVFVIDPPGHTEYPSGFADSRPFQPIIPSTPCNLAQTVNSPSINGTTLSHDLLLKPVSESSASATSWNPDYQAEERLVLNPFQVGTSIPSVPNVGDVNVHQSEIQYSTLNEQPHIQQDPIDVVWPTQPLTPLTSTHDFKLTKPSVTGDLAPSYAILPLLIPLQSPIQPTNQLINDVISRLKSLTLEDNFLHQQETVDYSPQCSFNSELTHREGDFTDENVQFENKFSPDFIETSQGEHHTTISSLTNASSSEEPTLNTNTSQTYHPDKDLLEKSAPASTDNHTFPCPLPSLKLSAKFDGIQASDAAKWTPIPSHAERLPDLNEDSNTDTTRTLSKFANITLKDVLLVFAGFLINMFPMGLSNSFGVMYTHLTSSYNLTDFEVSWIGSTMTGTAGIGAVLGTPLLTAIGCRWACLFGGVLIVAGFLISAFTTNIYVLYVSLGVLPGCGTAFGQLASLICISRYFKRGRPFALGIAISGGSVGMMLFPVLWNLLLETFGWWITMLTVGGVAFNAVWPSLLINPPKQHVPGDYKELSDEKSSAHAYRVLLKNPYFVVQLLSGVCTGISVFVYGSYIPEYAGANQPGLSSTDIAMAVCSMGAGNFLGKIVFPSLSSISPRAPVIAYTVALTLCGVSNVLVPFCSTYATLVANSFSQGCFQGGWSSLSSLVSLSTFGKDTLSTSLGIIFLSIGLGCFAGPPSAGALESMAKQKDVLFYFAAGGYLVSVVLMLPLFMIKPNSDLDVTLNVKPEVGEEESVRETKEEYKGDNCRQGGVEEGETNHAFVEAG